MDRPGGPLRGPDREARPGPGSDGSRKPLVTRNSVILSLPISQETGMSTSLEGRTAVVFGVANKRSIAWSIAQGLHAAGAKLAITYQNERMALEAKDLILS